MDHFTSSATAWHTILPLKEKVKDKKEKNIPLLLCVDMGLICQWIYLHF